MKAVVKVFALLFISILVAGCASGPDRPEMSEREIYEAAQGYLKSKNFSLAVDNLQLLESRYPFGPYAEQAQLEIIYAYYRGGDNEAAVAAADRFVRLHPQHPKVDYAYYMRGLANYTEGEGFLERFIPTDMTQRDPGSTIQSFDDFRQLLQRFPDSEYAPDAKARMVQLRNRLARYEINVANYYFKRKAYLAAANRGRYVIENLPQTPAIPDALAVMVQAYLLLEMNDLADQSLMVLRKNYPNHPSLDKNGNFVSQVGKDQEGSLLNKATLGLLDRYEPPKFDNREETD
ncbi:MAG: outer membrane protein assembly factor BamD [Zhongshania aliphaticivorans]|jgi:outer membrane protein assembly factor BamD|uniref:Outer membrane protein assembly factor BamD n=1 Tax=Zhongshania aliphaticivorans TaxID=1470434 RepID=A0A127M840_9GAMM|nr:outer membrane protein assembly factor BamD [Zhongshania aliphaticivorans]AMO69375.1 competence protein ComL [Zhongshania aliphaticivorans]EIF42466.1 competence protein ComL [gamma proteobacterium BDW918]|tara:strand:- start:89042 stop:89911 length:870 start_codon:yes stop_codon:yes gene_type:complete